MKKINMLLGVVALCLLTFIPLKVSAAENVTFTESNGKYVSSAAISAGSFGVFAAGDVTYTYTDEANGIKTWEFYLTPSSNINYVYMELTPFNIDIQSIQAGSAFQLLSNQKTSTGNKVLLMANNVNGLTSGSRVLLFTVTTKDTAESGCVLSVSPQSLQCANVNDIAYFDNSGKQLSTKEEFTQACGNVTTDPNDVKNAETGSVIPYIAIAGGLLAIAGVYFYSRKSNKMYKL